MHLGIDWLPPVSVIIRHKRHAGDHAGINKSGYCSATFAAGYKPRPQRSEISRNGTIQPGMDPGRNHFGHAAECIRYRLLTNRKHALPEAGDTPSDLLRTEINNFGRLISFPGHTVFLLHSVHDFV